MDENQIPSLYNPSKPCGDLKPEDLHDVNIGPLCAPCPAHGHYAVRLYGATFSQSKSTGKVTIVQRYPALVMVNAN